MKINKRQLRKLIMEFVSLNENTESDKVKEKLKKVAGKSFMWGFKIDGKKASSVSVKPSATRVEFYGEDGELITTKTTKNDFAYLGSIADYLTGSYVMPIDGKAFRAEQKTRKIANKKGMDAINAILTGPSGEEVFGAEMAKYNKKKAEEELKKAEAEAKKAANIAEKRQELSDLYVGDPKQEEVLIAYDKHISKGVKPEVAAYRAKKYGLVSPNIDKEVAEEKKAAAAAEKKKKIRSKHFNTKTPSGNRLGSTIKNKAAGNKFREWVNKNYPALAKAKRNQMITVGMPDGKNYKVPGLNLDPSGSYTNSYIRKAWKLLGDAYLKPSKPSIDNANIQKAFQNLGQETDGSTPKMKLSPDGKFETVKEGLSRGSLYRQRYRRY